MDFRVVVVCSLGDGSGIHTKKQRVGIHSNSAGFVKLLLSICHHRSHFDLAFLGAVLHAQFCFLISCRRPREYGGRGGHQEHTEKIGDRSSQKEKEEGKTSGLASLNFHLA